MTKPEIGLVLMEQAFHDRLPGDLARDLSRRTLPMLVPFAGPQWAERPGDADAYIVELLRQAIGYRVRLR